MYEYCRPQRQSRRLALGVLAAAAANGGVGAAGAVGAFGYIYIYTYIHINGGACLFHIFFSFSWRALLDLICFFVPLSF